MNTIGVDWGSSNRRAYWLDAQGCLLAQRQDAAGVLATPPGGQRDFAAELQSLIGDWRAQAPAQVWLSGMVGSRSGWQEAPYLPLPCHLHGLGEAATPLAADPQIRLLPGLCQRPPLGPHDVMRGEETQLLGAWRLRPQNGWVLLPGTHSKWAQVENGRVLTMHSAMTGELFALLRRHSCLSAVAGGDEPPAPIPAHESAFDEGLQWAREGGGLAQLFRLRAQALLTDEPQPPAEVAARLSGLLIGLELQARQIHSASLVAAPGLAHWYTRAAARQGLTLHALDPDQCLVAALQALQTPTETSP